MAFKLRPIPLLALAAVVFGVVMVLAGNGGVISNLVPSDKKVVSCDVTVSNKIAADPKIENFICQRQSNCLGLLSIANLQPQFLIPTDTVFVQSVAADGAKSSAVKLEITEQTLGDSSKTAELTVCTSSLTGQLKLLNKDSQLIEAKPWVVN